MVFLGNRIMKPRCPQEPVANGVGHRANWVSLARMVVFTIIISFSISREELLLVFHTSAKKRIKGDFFSLCYWGESPFHPNELCCLQGARLICLWCPLCIVSRLTCICVFSFTIKWYKWKLIQTVVFHCYPPPWKTTGMIQPCWGREIPIDCSLSKQRFAVHWGKVSPLSCLVRSLWRRCFKHLT